jgi:Ca2+-binding EF-hand superfamily protein
MGIFNSFDCNGDGVLTLQEMAKAFKRVVEDYSDETMQKFFKICDKDESGTLDFEEFKEFIKTAIPSSAATPPTSATTAASDTAALKALFDAFDEDGNGGLDKREVLKVMRNWGLDLSPEELDAAWPTFDTNGDGLVDFDEFRKLIETP